MFSLCTISNSMKLMLRLQNSVGVSSRGFYKYADADSKIYYDQSNMQMEIKSFLQSNDIRGTIGYTGIQCDNPFVRSKTKTCYINLECGEFISLNSNHRGNWQEFKDCVMNKTKIEEIEMQSLNKIQPITEAIDIWRNESVLLSQIPQNRKIEFEKKFNISRISRNIFDKYNIRATSDYKSLIIPWFEENDSARSMLGMKLISYDDDGFLTENFIPYQQYHHIFGLHDVPANHDKIIITNNEVSAMSINMKLTGIKAVSLPYGYGCNRLPLEVLPHLERFKEIICWFDPEVSTLKKLLKLSKKLGVKRYLWDQGPK